MYATRKRALIIGEYKVFQLVFFPYGVDVLVEVMTILFIDAKAAVARGDNAVRRFDQALELPWLDAAEVGKYLRTCHAREFAHLLIVAIGALQAQAYRETEMVDP